MTRHFLYFIQRDVHNRLARQLRRLRSPRYAIAALVGLVYFFFVFGGWMPSADAGRAIGGQWISAGRVAGPLILAVLASWWWLWGGHRHALVLSRAETDLLLTAPLSRAQIIQFKILQAQPGVLFSAAIGTLVMRGTGLPWPLRLLSLWLMLAILHQHQIAASLVHAAADEHGRTGIRRNLVAVVLFGLAFLTLAWSVVAAVADVRANPTLAYAADRLVALLSEPGPTVVLAPFRLVLAPILATSIAAWLPAIAAAALVLLAHTVWLVRTDAAFEESAVAEGQRREARVAAVRSGGRARVAFTRRSRSAAAAWLPLHPGGRAAYAVFWKNVLYAQRSIRSMRAPLIFIVLMMLFVVGGGGATGGGLIRAVAFVCIGAGVLISAFGPAGVRNDLRMDLMHIEQLRILPLRSRDLVTAEVAAATVTLTLPQVPILLVGITLFAIDGSISGTAALLLGGGALFVVPVVNTLAVIIQNAIALLYPSWVRLGGFDTAGMEAVGQNMIVMVGTLLLLGLCSIPPLLAGTLVGAPLSMLIDDGAIVAGALTAAAVAAGEAALLIMWLGRLYDRTDPVVAGILT